MTVTTKSRTEQSRRYDSDAVGAAVCIPSRVDQYRVPKVVPEGFAQPFQVRHVGLIDRGRQLDLDSDDASVRADDDEVHLVVTAVGANVTHFCFGVLRVHPQVERHQTLEESAEEGAVPRHNRPDCLAREHFDAVAPNSLAANAGSAI